MIDRQQIKNFFLRQNSSEKRARIILSKEELDTMNDRIAKTIPALNELSYRTILCIHRQISYSAKSSTHTPDLKPVIAKLAALAKESSAAARKIKEIVELNSTAAEPKELAAAHTKTSELRQLH